MENNGKLQFEYLIDTFNTILKSDMGIFESSTGNVNFGTESTGDLKLFLLAHIILILNVSLDVLTFLDTETAAAAAPTAATNTSADRNHYGHEAIKTLFEEEMSKSRKDAMGIRQSSLPKHLLDMMYSLCCITNFDSQVLDDFMTYMSLQYYPASSRKTFLLMVGPPQSGKTTILKMLTMMNKPSKYNTDKIFNPSTGGGGGAAPEMIKICSSYFASFVEVKEIDSTTLKTITGNDNLDKRGVHSNVFVNLDPLVYVSGAANKLPSIDVADEAIRERIAIFYFNHMYVDEEAADEINPLLLYAKHQTLKSVNINEEFMARHLSNLLYAQFCLKRNHMGVVHASLKNTTSIYMMTKLLCENNIIYQMMHDAGIRFHPTLSITVSELKHKLQPEMDRRQEEEFNWRKIKGQINVLFSRFLMADKMTFRGFGVPLVSASTAADNSMPNSPHRILKKTTAAVAAADRGISIAMLRHHLKGRQYESDSIMRIVKDCVETFAENYNKQEHRFVGLEFVTN